MGLPSGAFMDYSYNQIATFHSLMEELYGDNYYIRCNHSSMHATYQLDFSAKNPDKASQRIYMPYYIVESRDINQIKDFLDPYLIHLTITECCDIMREAIKLAKKE